MTIEDPILRPKSFDNLTHFAWLTLRDPPSEALPATFPIVRLVAPRNRVELNFPPSNLSLPRGIKLSRLVAASIRPVVNSLRE